MGAGDRLRELDSRVLPRLAGNLSRLGRGPARLRFVVGVSLLSAMVVLVTALWAQRHDADDEAPGPALGPVGVVQGQPVDGYVRATREELAALRQPSTEATAPMFALLSFTGYLSPVELVPVLAGASVAQVYARVPLGGIASQVQRIPAYRVPEDVRAGMLDEARLRDRERGEFVRLDVTVVGTGDGEQRLRRAYRAAAEVAGVEADAYRAGCGCVFAAVVYATVDVLGQIAVRPGVRAVDPAPEIRRLDRVEFRPPLPEQRTGGSDSPDGYPSSPSATVRPPGRADLARPLVSCPPSAWTSSPPTVVTSDSPVDPDASSRRPAGVAGRSTAVPSGLPGDPRGATRSAEAGESRRGSGR